MAGFRRRPKAPFIQEPASFFRKAAVVVTLEHITRFEQPSGFSSQGELRFACAQNQCQVPVFFLGNLLAPRRTADQLLALSRVVASRFHLPPALLARILREADPVITCSPQGIRWEGFSGCCSAYARLDLLPQALDGALLGHGTTNVDLGPEARAGLARLGDKSCRLEVGSQALALQTDERVIVERRVPLPVRWLKGLVEVQSIMADMRKIVEVSAIEARRFLQSLPKGPSRGACWVVPSGRGLRLSQIASPDGVQLTGWQRLAVLQDLLRHGLRLRVYAHSGGSSGWELVCPDSHFFLILSPEVWRGFSGEGQVLDRLASCREPALELAELDWSQVLSLQRLLELTRLPSSQLSSSLAAWASQGQLGYDLGRGGYFRRQLPFAYERLEALHPRLQEARKLSLEWQGQVALVKSKEVVYRVSWQEGVASCNCPWYAQHALERGPCKHILAAQLDLEKDL